MPIIDITEAVDIALDKAGLDATREDDVTLMLTLSAGKQGTTLCYRPWYVAAKAIEQSQDYQSLTEADGAKFTNLVRVIQSLLQWQHSVDVVDAELSVVVPDAFSALAALAELEGGCPPVMSIMVG